jgi:hypothetical protein
MLIDLILTLRSFACFAINAYSSLFKLVVKYSGKEAKQHFDSDGRAGTVEKKRAAL